MTDLDTSGRPPIRKCEHGNFIGPGLSCPECLLQPVVRKAGELLAKELRGKVVIVPGEHQLQACSGCIEKVKELEKLRDDIMTDARWLCSYAGLGSDPFDDVGTARSAIEKDVLPAIELLRDDRDEKHRLLIKLGEKLQEVLGGGEGDDPVELARMVVEERDEARARWERAHGLPFSSRMPEALRARVGELEELPLARFQVHENGTAYLVDSGHMRYGLTGDTSRLKKSLTQRGRPAD